MQGLPTVTIGKKDYTIDYKLEEIRYLKYGYDPQFIPFDSVQGNYILDEFEVNNNH